MKYFVIFFLFSITVFSQTENPLINTVIQEAKSQNIETKDQVLNILNSYGMTEAQAIEMAELKGISYEQLIDELTSKNDMDFSLENEKEEKPDKNLEEFEENIQSTNYKYNLSPGYFGYNIFNNNPYLNKEYLTGNVDEGYLIAPGDEIRIITYGDNSLNQQLIVDKNGNININGYGLFFASGSTFKTLKSRLKIFLGKYLSGLTTNPPKTFMDVSLTQIKPVKVVVLGQVNAPGPHILNTSGSALSALYAAGGVKTSGTLREIKVYRNNKLIKTIDLYDYITNGNLKDDIRLTNNDIIFVGPRKSKFFLLGEVYNSSFYELLPNEGLNELIKFSGGLPITAQTSKINISRIIPPEDRSDEVIADRKLLTLNYQDYQNKSKNIELFDGDKITFFKILDIQLNQVKVSGHVVEPGVYSITKYGDLRSLIQEAASGLLPNAFLERVDVTSFINGIPVFNTYNLEEILSNKITIPLKDMDEVVVYSNQRVEGSKTVSIEGYGVENNIIEWRENLSLHDFIFENSQINNPEFLKDLLKSRIDIKRFNPSSGKYSTLKFNFNKIDNLKSNFLLPKDKVILYGLNSTKNTDLKVGIFGFVKFGDFYDLNDNMYAEDLILLAGGYSDESIDQSKVTVNRIEINADNERLLRKYIIDIDNDYLLGLKEKPDHGFILTDKDLITANIKKGFNKPKAIKVSGEVVFPQVYISEFRNPSFKDIIDFTGGLTEYAHLNSSKIIRNGSVINIKLNKIKKNEMVFEDGDEIFINSKEGTVITNGKITNPSTFIWKKGKRAAYYIRNSAGRIKKESGKMYLTSDNGFSKKINFFNNPKVDPNSIITVNPKKEKVRDKQPFSFNQTLSLIATTITTALLIERL